jgi:hypothetical protein
LGLKGGQRIRLTTSPSSASLFSTKCGKLGYRIQPYFAGNIMSSKASILNIEVFFHVNNILILRQKLVERQTEYFGSGYSLRP